MRTKLLILLNLFFLICTNAALSLELKIGLITTSNQVTIGSNKKSKLINLCNNREIEKINKNETFIVQNITGLISVKNRDGYKIGAFSGPLKLTFKDKNSKVLVNKDWYRGNIIVLTNGDKRNITVVNEVDLEDYLKSVVPSEIPYTWNKEALKAQSVAARSYALGFLGRRKVKGYDLESGIEDQVYLGIKSEKSSTTDAVNSTGSIILLSGENKPLIALYHSSGGGYTDSIENLWDKKDIKSSTHILPRPDYDDNSPYFKWTQSYKLNAINDLFKNLNIGNITNIVPMSRSFSQRIMWLKIIGTNRDTIIRGEDFRRRLKLPSSKFNLIIEDGKNVKFAGRGNGHGLGLSQWGAKALAEHDFNFKQILAHYYPGARLVILPYNSIYKNHGSKKERSN